VDAAAPQQPPYRRIGEILVGKALITAEQLAVGLDEQQRTGRPLGEICVDRFKLDRLSLADALAEQWEEMQRSAVPLASLGLPAGEEPAEDGEHEATSEDDLRALLEEAQAARTELTIKTDELSTRLAALETLVVGVRDALVELRPQGGNGGARKTRPQPRRAAAR
jgi:hypothetical protein